MTPLSPESVALAYQRIAPFITKTPLMQSRLLDSWLGHEIIFKVEAHQKIGAFKARGNTQQPACFKRTGRSCDIYSVSK
jgi:threo-3-hydroxy-L-aspartate ammonia-lyase